MEAFFNWLSSHPTIQSALLIFLAILVLAVCAFVLFTEREIIWRDLKIGPRSNPSSKSSTEENIIHANHRTTPYKHINDAFGKGEDILMISIMSQHTLREIAQRLEQPQQPKSFIKVLTLDPDISPDVIEAIRLHLNENSHNPQETIRQVKNAWDHWCNLAKRYPNRIEVRKYKSIPTLQAVFVGNEYVNVELLPYNTYTNDRPAIMMTRKEQPELFSLFWEKYNKLWHEARS